MEYTGEMGKKMVRMKGFFMCYGCRFRSWDNGVEGRDIDLLK